MEKENQIIFGMTNQKMVNAEDVYVNQLCSGLRNACKMLSEYRTCPEQAEKRHSIDCDVICDVTADNFDSSECWYKYFMEDC